MRRGTQSCPLTSTRVEGGAPRRRSGEGPAQVGRGYALAPGGWPEGPRWGGDAAPPTAVDVSALTNVELTDPGRTSGVELEALLDEVTKRLGAATSNIELQRLNSISTAIGHKIKLGRGADGAIAVGDGTEEPRRRLQVPPRGPKKPATYTERTVTEQA